MPLLAGHSNRFLAGLSIALLLAGAGVAWLGREPLLAWYYLRGLEKAGEGEREVWVQRVVGLGSAAVPGVLDCLGKDDARVCANAQAALARLAESWSAEDPRWAELSGRLCNDFRRFSPAGQESVLKLAADWLTPRGVPDVERGARSAGVGAPRYTLRAPRPVRQHAVRLLEQAARASDQDVHAAALDLAGTLLEQGDWTGLLGPCRELARSCLRDARPDNRTRAVRIALHPGMDLVEQVVPLLHDIAPEVRRAAMLVVGAAKETVTTDYLLPWLHDPDAEVRRLCETALLARDLKREHLQLARLISDSRPRVRLQVLHYLDADLDLEPGAWLRRLSQDSEEAVRVAAIRAAFEQSGVDLTDRLEEMAQSDPSPTVRQIAGIYLAFHKLRE